MRGREWPHDKQWGRTWANQAWSRKNSILFQRVLTDLKQGSARSPWCIPKAPGIMKTTRFHHDCEVWSQTDSGT